MVILLNRVRNVKKRKKKKKRNRITGPDINLHKSEGGLRRTDTNIKGDVKKREQKSPHSHTHTNRE